MTQKEFDKLVYVKHPDEDIWETQLNFLEACPADEFEFRRLFLNYGNATCHYDEIASGVISLHDYEDWLEGLPEKIAAAFRQKGFEGSKSTLPLLRHVMERRDVGMDEFVAGLLKQEDLDKWKQYGDDLAERRRKEK